MALSSGIASRPDSPDSAGMLRQNENISPKDRFCKPLPFERPSTSPLSWAANEVFNLLARQLTALQQEKLEGVNFVPNHEDPLDVQAIVEGPIQTPCPAVFITFHQ